MRNNLRRLLMQTMAMANSYHHPKPTPQIIHRSRISTHTVTVYPDSLHEYPEIDLARERPVTDYSKFD
jgi:hypothetical protein